MDVLTTVLTAILSTSVGVVVTTVVARAKVGGKRYKAVQDGLRSLCRAEIIRQHEKYTERGYCPIYAKDAVRKTYEAYHELGGNGVITDLYNDIIALPEMPPQPQPKTRRNKKTEDN